MSQHDWEFHGVSGSWPSAHRGHQVKDHPYQEAPTWQTGSWRGAKLLGNESISAFCFHQSHCLPPGMNVAGLSHNDLCFGSVIMVVSGCQVCGLFVFLLFVFLVGEIIYYPELRSSGLWEVPGSRDSFIEGSVTRIIPNLRLSTSPPFLCLWMFSPVDVL